MHPKQLLFLLSFLFVNISLNSQSIFSNSPVSLGHGNTGVTSFNAWSPLLNPAGIAKFDNIAISASYHLPYSISELSSKNAIGTIPFKFGTIGAYVNQYGFSLYQENRAGISFARSITSKFHASFQLNYQNNHSNQSGSGGQIFSGAGIIFEPLETLQMGISILNPEKSKLTILEESFDIPSVFIIGFNWYASNDFDISLEMEKQDKFEAIYKLGLEYSIINKVWIRTGVYGKPLNYTFGLGFKTLGFNLDAGMAYHEALGATSCFGITYAFNKKQ